MQRDLERRLQALETSWFGSLKIAAYVRALCTMSKEEFHRALEQAESPEGVHQSLIEHFSDAELDRVMKDNDRAIRVHQLLDGTE